MNYFSLVANRRLLLSCSLSFLLISCGGGGDSKPNVPVTPPPVEPTPTYQNITVIDGYIRGAIAFIDLNDNKALDDNEPWIETEASGFGQIETTSLGLSPEDIKVIVTVPSGAVDESTISSENPDGVPFTQETAFQMLSLPGENIATPFTTLVAIIAENDADVETTKIAIAESLGITTVELSSDYLKVNNKDLSVLAELIIANQVIPQDLTNTVTAAEQLVATTVSSQISFVIKQANENGTLTENIDAIGEAARAAKSAVSSFVEDNTESLTNDTRSNFTVVIGLLNEVIYNSFESVVNSTEEVSAEDIAQASQRASLMQAVITDLLVEDINLADGISEERLTETAIIIDVISDVVEAIVLEDLYEAEDTNLLTEIAIIAAETAQEQLRELENNNLTNEEIADILAVSTSEIFTNLQVIAESGTDLNDIDGDGIANGDDTDIDGDGVINENDAFDYDATESVDTDLDGVGDNSDTDIDGDGYLNNADAFPLNSLEWLDTDGDDIGNNTDPDIDGDGHLNEDDAFPLESTEWTDNDGDGIGDNADPDDNGDGIVDSEITLMAQDRDGIINDAQDFVFSPDGRFMYVGSVNGLVIITMGDDGKPTETSQLVTPSELGLEKITNSTYLDFSSDGNLYWSLIAQKGDVTGGAIIVLAVDSADGSAVSSQFTHLSEISELSVSIIEIFKISSNNRFLYATGHYGASGNNLLVYNIDSVTGHLTYASSFALANYLDYEHNFDISYDDQYLYYGYSNSEASIQILALDQDTGEVTSSATQVLTGYNSHNLSLITSKISYKLFLAADEYFMTLDIANDGTLTIDDTLNYNVAGAGVKAMDINAEENKVVIGSYGSGTDLRVDYLTMDASGLNHQFSNNKRDDLILDIQLSPDDGRVIWIGWYNDIINSIELNEGDTIIQQSIGAIGLEHLTDFVVDNDTALAINSRGHVTSINELNNGLGFEYSLSNIPALRNDVVDASILLGDRKVMFFSRDRNRTQYVVGEVPIAGGEFINVDTHFLGEESESYRVIKGKLLSENRLLTYERSPHTSFENESYGYGLALYSIEDDNSLTLLDALSTDDYPRYAWEYLDVAGDDFYIGNKSYTFKGDVLATKESDFARLTDFIISPDNAYVYSVEYSDENNDKLVTYSHNETTGALVEIVTENLIGRWNITLLESQQLLMVSHNVDKAISVDLVDISKGDEITSVSKTTVTTSTSTEAHVNVKNFEGTVWLFVSGGYFDVLKLRIN